MAATDFLSAQATNSPAITHITETAANVTASLFKLPSSKDIALFPFRLLAKADRFVFRTAPRYAVQATRMDAVARRAVGFFVGRIAQGGDAGAVAEAAAVGPAVVEASSGWTSLFADAFQASTFKSYWGMIHYLTSRWAFACFVMALTLNRISVYGSSRQRIFLSWTWRLALRLVPIILFLTQIRSLLQAIRCQTSPDFSLYRHGDNNKYSLLDWSTDGGSMHTISSTLLYWSDDASACAAVEMSRPQPEVRARFGSFSLLWPTFLHLCLSHIVENLSSSLQQLPMMTEVAISVFEHSLAFAEAETMVAHALGMGFFQPPKSSNATSTPKLNETVKATIPASGTILALTDAAAALKGPHIFDKVNVPVEVLLIALLSCGNALTSHIISVFGKQRRLRLINTGFWGICFMLSFTWGFFTTSTMVRSDGGTTRPVSGLLHFPTVAIVSFLPHMAVIIGIVMCGCIYLTALLLTAVSLGTNPSIRQPSSLKERFTIAHENLQAAIQMKGISVRWYEDFYTALLRVGFACLTAASEAVFLNEGRSVAMRQFTWLEDERLDELELTANGHTSSDGHNFQIVEEYCVPGSGIRGDSHSGQWSSGYTKERKVDRPKNGDLQNKDSFVYPNPRTDGVGALQRTTRFYLLLIFLRGITFTIGGWIAYGIGQFLDRIGITARPRWLRRTVGASLKQLNEEREKLRAQGIGKSLDFWLIDEEGKLTKPASDEMDIEPEMRKRVINEHEDNVDQILDQKMYDWWKMGGWYGTKDNSGEYQPPVKYDEGDDDTTSVISHATTSTNATEDENAWESEPEGQRTPTQTTMTSDWSFAGIHDRSRSPSQEPPILDNATLARLLNPPDRASREEARVMASHLASSTVVTRSRYRSQFQATRANILLAGRSSAVSTQNNVLSSTMQISRPLSGEEEAEILEQLILSRRKRQNKTVASGSDDDDSSRQVGPPCVVCQAEPRTIIAWPCRCLTVCEDCRVSLAMNNFGNCVTCRRNVGGFVRLYVP